MTAQKEPVTAHMYAATSCKVPKIVPIVAAKDHIEAATAHFYPFEATATTHEKMEKLFL